MKSSFCIPADVPTDKETTFITHYNAFTKGNTGIFLFAADHVIEHPIKDMQGAGIDPQARNPEHIFTIAQKSHISALAAPLGLIARYAPSFSNIHYIAKLNSKTDIIPLCAKDPESIALWSIEQVVTLHAKGVPLLGIGYTVYVGSEYETTMLHQAAQLIYQAHQHGLLAILWMYPRGKQGKQIEKETDETLIAGAAGIACALGADIVKVKIPTRGNQSITEGLTLITRAAGNTRVICAGGPQQSPTALLQMVQEYRNNTPIAGFAIGRNIFQLPVPKALALTQQLSTLIFKGNV